MGTTTNPSTDKGEFSAVRPLSQHELEQVLSRSEQTCNLRILSLLGAGGFAAVYEVEDLNTTGHFALKVIDPVLTAFDQAVKDAAGHDGKRDDSDEEAHSLFQSYLPYYEKKADDEVQIARIVNDTQCPHLLPVNFFCVLDAQAALRLPQARRLWVLAMPKLLCLGKDFKKVFPNGIRNHLLLKLGIDVCRALEILHDLGRHGGRPDPQADPAASDTTVYVRPDQEDRYLIHRDVKPGNIYLLVHPPVPGTAEPIFDCVLGDYGISRSLSANTHLQTEIASDFFKAPELSFSYTIATPAADLYSVARVLLWALWRDFPLREYTHLKELCGKILPSLFTKAEDPPLPAAFFADISRWLFFIHNDRFLGEADKVHVLTQACRGRCSVQLLTFLLDMTKERPADRPCQSATAMRNVLEGMLLAEPASCEMPAEGTATPEQQDESPAAGKAASPSGTTGAAPDGDSFASLNQASQSNFWATEWSLQNEEFLKYQKKASEKRRDLTAYLQISCLLLAVLAVLFLLNLSNALPVTGSLPLIYIGIALFCFWMAFSYIALAFEVFSPKDLLRHLLAGFLFLIIEYPRFVFIGLLIGLALSGAYFFLV